MQLRSLWRDRLKAFHYSNSNSTLIGLPLLSPYNASKLAAVAASKTTLATISVPADAATSSHNLSSSASRSIASSPRISNPFRYIDRPRGNSQHGKQGLVHHR